MIPYDQPLSLELLQHVFVLQSKYSTHDYGIQLKSLLILLLYAPKFEKCVQAGGFVSMSSPCDQTLPMVIPSSSELLVPGQQEMENANTTN